MSRSIRKHFNELLKEHDARKPSRQSGYRRNIGKRSRKEINVGGIHDVSGLFKSYGSESDLAYQSPSVLGPSNTSNRRSIRGGTHSTPLHGGDLAQEQRPSPAKKSRLNADARIQNTTVSIGTQTLQDIDLNEEDESQESSFTDDDRPNVTYRHIGTQMESSSVRRNSTFRHGTSDRYLSSHHNPSTKVIYKDAGTSSRRSGSIRKSSQTGPSKSRGDSYHSRLAYSSVNERQTNESLTMSDQEPMAGDEGNELHVELSQHDMQSTSWNTGYKSRSTHSSHTENASKKAFESERDERNTTIDRRSVLNAYTEMIDSQRKMTSSQVIGDSPSKGSSRKKLSSSSLRKRLSFRNDANAQSPFAPSKKPGKVIKDLISSTKHGDPDQIELDDIIDVCDDASAPKSPICYSRRSSSKLRFVRTEPKPTRNYGRESSNPVASVSSIGNRNQAKRELSFSGRHPKNKESSTKKKLTLSSKAKKSLDYPSPLERSPQKLKKGLSRHSENRNHRSIHHETATYSLVNYSVSEEDSTTDEADCRTSKSRLSRNELNHSQKKRRRSSRRHRSFFKSMREENMAAEVESALVKNARKRDSYAIMSDDDGNVIRLSTGRRKNVTRSRIPVSSSLSDSDFESTHKISGARRLETDSPSDNEEHPTVIEHPSRKRTSPRKLNNRNVIGSPSQCIQAPHDLADRGDGPVPVSKNVEEWLKTASHAREKVSVRDATQQRRSKYSLHDSTAESLRPFGDASVIRDRESMNFNRFNSNGNNFGPPSSTPRVPKARKTKPILNAEVSEEGEGDDLIGLEEDSEISQDSYTITSRRRKRTNNQSKTVPNDVASLASAKTPAYQPTPKYKKSSSARKKLSSSFAQTNPDNASQSEINDTVRVVGSPLHNEDIGEVHDVSTNNIPVSVNTEDDGLQENAASPGPAKSAKSNTGKRAGKVKKNTKSKHVKEKKATPRDQPIVPTVNNSNVLFETKDYVVLPLPASMNEDSGVRRSTRIRSKVFNIGEGFEYSNTFDENGFPKIIGIRVKKDTNTGNRKKGGRAKKNKTKSKTTAKKNQKKGKKTKGQGSGAMRNSTNVSEPDVSHDANVEQPEVSDPTILPTISEEGEPPDMSGTGDASANRTIPIQERTVNLLNSTTNSYNTIDFLSIVSHDDGLLGTAPPAYKVVSGIEITRGINLSNIGISSCVQGRIVIKPKKKKAERTAGSGTMCFFVHQGSVEVTVSGESVVLPYSSYFQVPHKNSYSLYNPDKKIDTVLFYALNLDSAASERT